MLVAFFFCNRMRWLAVDTVLMRTVASADIDGRSNDTVGYEKGFFIVSVLWNLYEFGRTSLALKVCF